jgi:hypothetical protein
MVQLARCGSQDRKRAGRGRPRAPGGHYQLNAMSALEGNTCKQSNSGERGGGAGGGPEAHVLHSRGQRFKDESLSV